MDAPSKIKSPFLRQLWTILADGMKRIENGECDERSAIAMVGRYNAESKGYIDEHSTINYDDAMKMTGIKSRNKFKALCDANHISQVRINNMNVGFRLSEIEYLANKIRKN